MSIRPWRSAMAVVFLAAAALISHPGIATAVPPPPPNPSDDDIETGRERAEATAGLVGQLANQVAEADAALLLAQSDVALKREETNKALIDLATAENAAAAAQAAATSARQEADAANAQIARAQQQIDQFAAASYRQGNLIGSISSFLGSDSPEDLLARAELLDSVGGAQLDVLEQLKRARARSANKDSLAREALVAAQSARQAADRAKAVADSAYRAATGAEAAQAGQMAALQARKADLERRLYEAQRAVAGLEGQRQRYADWVAERAREQAAAAAAAATESLPVPDSAGLDALDSRAAARTVINRAMSQLGVRYSWGGGNANGPTRGIRDGGVADAHGDYRSVGFDCSGLMIYAFAPVLGYSLPHYSGAQYHSGGKVPLSRKRPGDLLFWSTRGRIHHVALYIGNGQMIEAPYSGAAVRVAPVRYGGIMPYATRVF